MSEKVEERLGEAKQKAIKSYEFYKRYVGRKALGSPRKPEVNTSSLKNENTKERMI